ncbi:uncharacterized protein [Diadema antillarum]|uniref:uncharacterized protein n=1 Tax=Diadema antillarum TaxID=105358 RepID=UPI003A841A84
MPRRRTPRKTASPELLVTETDSGGKEYHVTRHAQLALNMLSQCWRHHPGLCDTTIVIEDEQFHAHIAVLMACSEYFREVYSLTAQPGKELAEGELSLPGKTVHLSQLTAGSFRSFLEFAYSGKLCLTMQNVEDWLHVGITLKVHSVKEAAKEYLKSQTNSDNCVDIIAIAEKFALADIKHKANHVMCERLILLSQSYHDQGAPEKEQSSDDNDFGPEPAESGSEAENQPATEKPVRRSPQRKQPLRPARQARYHSQAETSQASSPRKVETKAALKAVVHRPRRTRKHPEPRAPSQRVSAMRQRALKAKREAIGVAARSKPEYSCKFCELVFPRYRELQTHYTQEHAKCATCKKMFRHPDELQKHREEHRKPRRKVAERSKCYTCPFCGKNCHYSSALKIHVRTHTGEKPYECEICQARFIQSINLKRHILSYHKDEEPYACDICGKRFRVLVYLKSHEVTHSQDRPFQCEACGAMFKRKSDLRSHRRVHSSDKPYACGVCLTKFKTTNDLKTHMLIHNDKKPHACEQCGATFKRSGHLNRHMMIHTNKKPFQCDQCGAQFNRKENLRSHERIHSGEFPYSCKSCDANFRHLSSLKTHEKTHVSMKPKQAMVVEEAPQNPRLLMRLLTPAGETHTPTITATSDALTMVAATMSTQTQETDALQLAQRTPTVPIQLHVASTSLQDLAGVAGASGSIDISLVNLATGTLTQSQSPPPPPPQTQLQQPSPNPDALLTLNTTQALAQVQAEAQAQIQAQMNSQSAPLQLTTQHHVHSGTNHHHAHQHHQTSGQVAETLIQGSIPSVAVQGSHSFML